MMTAVPIAKAAPGWSPTPFSAPAARPRPMLAQTVVAAPVSPPGAAMTPPTPPSFIDSALVSAIFAGVGTVAYGTLTAGAYKAKWQKSTIIFGAMTALLGVKAILDLADVRTR